MNADPLAPIYRWLEYAAFARTLEHCRFFFLPQLAEARRALLLGEGDGRFLSRLLAHNRNVTVDVVEQSQAMIASARGTAEAHRVRFQALDAREASFDSGPYDLVVTHFFIDCFSEADARHLVSAVARAMTPDGVWIVSEFQLPQRRWARWHAQAWLAVMYRFFGWTTGLSVRRIPPYRDMLRQCGLVCLERKEWRWGLIAAERYARTAL